MATIKDVAKRAGMSIATTSRVLNNYPNVSINAVNLVNKAIKELNYIPNENARALASKKSNIIGIIVNDLSSPFFGSMVKCADLIADEKGKQLLIGSGYHDSIKEKKAIELLIKSKCELIVFHAKGLSDSELIELYKKSNNIVFINRNINKLESRCVSLNNYHGSYIAVSHLIKNGHKKIAYICSSHNIDDASDRLDGYLSALKENNIEPDLEYIEYVEPNEKGGEEGMIRMLSKNLDMTAIATYNDYIAAGAMGVLQENGFNIPRDISVIGFDDAEIAKYIFPRLTTMHYPIEQMVKKALNLYYYNKNKESADKNVFMPILISRSSVRNIRLRS